MIDLNPSPIHFVNINPSLARLEKDLGLTGLNHLIKCNLKLIKLLAALSFIASLLPIFSNTCFVTISATKCVNHFTRTKKQESTWSQIHWFVLSQSWTLLVVVCPKISMQLVIYNTKSKVSLIAEIRKNGFYIHQRNIDTITL